MSSFTPIPRPVQQKTNTTANENNPNITAICNDNNDNSSSSSSMGKSTNSVRLQPWQLRALQNGRAPLPEAPGARPCIDPRASSQVAGSQLSNPTSSIDVLSSSGSTNAEEASSGAEATSMTYRFWSGDDMRSLITLRNSGATWPDVYAVFPERTPEAIKQAYHKRRHAIEREMVEAEAASNSQINGNSGTNN